MNYYISDLHIGCKNKFENRTLEHDELLVKNWNSVVKNNDTVYILGDIGKFGRAKDNEYVASIISRLKGNKVLIVGNHDSDGLKDNRIKQLFIEICDYKEIIDNFNGINQKLVLSHYPIFSWNGCYKDTILLYGHMHDNFDEIIFQESLVKLRKKVTELNNDSSQIEGFYKLKSRPYAFNVGVMLDKINYTPRTCKEIIY